MWPRNSEIQAISLGKFDGYFEDIRILARRTLPPDTPQKLKPMFDSGKMTTSMKLLPTEFFRDDYFNEQRATVPNLEGSNPLELNALITPMRSSHYDVQIPRKKEKKNLCSKERLVGGTLVYLAVMVLILVVIVGILAAMLTAQNNGDTQTITTNKVESSIKGSQTTNEDENNSIVMSHPSSSNAQTQDSENTAILPTRLTTKSTTQRPTITKSTTRPTTTTKSTTKPTTTTKSTTRPTTTTTKSTTRSTTTKSTTRPTTTKSTTRPTTTTKSTTRPTTTTTKSTTMPTTTKSTTRPTTTTKSTTRPTTTTKSTTRPTTTTKSTTRLMTTTTKSTTRPMTTTTKSTTRMATMTIKPTMHRPTTTTTLKLTTSSIKPTTTTTTTSKPRITTTTKRTTIITTPQPKTTTTLLNPQTTKITTPKPRTTTSLPKLSITTTPKLKTTTTLKSQTTATTPTPRTTASTLKPSTAKTTTATIKSQTTTATAPTHKATAKTTETTKPITMTTTPKFKLTTTSTSEETKPKTTITTTRPITTILSQKNSTTVTPTTMNPTTAPGITTTKVSTTTGVPICDTNECWSIYYLMSYKMNTSVHPCQDFYHYSCGNWISLRMEEIQNGYKQKEDNSVVADTVEQNVYSRVFFALFEPPEEEHSTARKLVHRLFSLCESSNTMERLQSDVTIEIKDVLSPLMIDANFPENTDDVSRLPVEDLHNTGISSFGTGAMFSVALGFDIGANGRQYILKVGPPTLFLPQHSYLQAIDSNLSLQDYLSKTSQILTNIFTNSPTLIPSDDGSDTAFRKKRSVESIEKAIKFLTEKVVMLEANIARIIQQTSGNIQNKILPLTEASQRWPFFQWEYMLSERHTQTSILFENVAFFDFLDDLLGSTEEKVKKFFIYHRILFNGIWKYLPYPTRKYLRNLSDGYLDYYYWDSCIKTLVRLTPDDLFSVFMEQNAEETQISKVQYETLTREIAQTLIRLISNGNVISQATQKSTIDILSTVKFSYPLNRSKNELGQNLHFFTKGDVAMSFLKFAVHLEQRKLDLLMNDLNVPPSVNMPWIRWIGTSPKYDPIFNEIGVPIVSLIRQSRSQPAMSIYSSTGFEIALVLMSAIFGERPMDIPFWWDQPSKNNLNNATECYANNLKTPAIPESTLVPDVMHGSGAFDMIYKENKALIKNLRLPMQQEGLPNGGEFFVLLAQNLCTISKFTEDGVSVQDWVNEMLTNDADFMKSFSCDAKSGLYKNTSCSVFNIES